MIGGRRALAELDEKGRGRFIPGRYVDDGTFVPPGWLRRHVPDRLFAAWHVLRGRPALYRVVFSGPVWVVGGRDGEELYVAGTRFDDAGRADIVFGRRAPDVDDTGTFA